MRVKLLAIALCAAALTHAHLPASAPLVVIAADVKLDQPGIYGLAKLHDALAVRGFRVAERAHDEQAEFVIVAGIGRDSEAARLLKPAGLSRRSSEAEADAPPTAPEALVVRRLAAIHGKPGLVLYGADARGLMYAALDAADRIARRADAHDPFANVRDTVEEPFLSERGVSMYTMHRSYFESRLYDQRHWQKYFDMLAASRINSFVVIFGYENGGFMAPPYPYFFDVAEFPNVKMIGLTSAEQSRNTVAFKTMMRLAHERGISVTAAIWDHIYRGGVQTGGIPGAPAGPDASVPGLVWGVTAENLSAYTKAALRRFLQVFPEVDAIQFRMHEESGLKRDEMVGFWHEALALIKAAKPDMRIDLRAKDLPDEVIEDAITQGLNARVSTKFWMEQMGLPFHPTHVNPQNQHDRRHGYADLLRYPQRYRVHWQLWSGGTTRLLLWGDPEYVRRFAGAARLYGGTSFEINEMLATKMLGEPHAAEPIAILTPAYRYYDYEFERYWHFYQLWGRLTYNPETPSSLWEEEFTRRFGTAAGPHVMRAEHLASQVLPRIVASSYRYAYFPTTRGWAEMKPQDDLPTFAGLEGSDTQQFMNPRDAARSALSGIETVMRRPKETSGWFAKTSDAILAELAEAEKAIGDRYGNEFRSSATDFRILAALARYYSWRLQAAVSYNIYKESGNLQSYDAALANEKQAIQAWSDIVQAAANVYSDRLPFGAPGHFPRHWREELQRLESDFEHLVAARPADSHAGATSVRPTDWPLEDPYLSATLTSARAAVPGQDFRITASISSRTPIKTVRLRYRHVTQFEDYETADMTFDPATHSYEARIPASFIDPKWDVMYFVEVIDTRGYGRMFPDFEKETPYVVAPVQR